MPENMLEVGARFLSGELQAGFESATAVIDEGTAEWRSVFDATASQVDAALESVAAASVEAGTVVKESMTGMEEKFVQAAESAKVSAAGIGGAFAGLGTLLGGGLLVGLMANFLDQTNKEVLELGHLSEKSGVAVEALGGLQLITRELGIEFSSVEQGLVRLERAQTLAIEGGKAQTQAFERLGITVKEISTLTPEELFNKISEAVHDSGSSADTAASAFALLGRGGAALIPIFKEYGGNLDEVMRKTGENTGVTEQAYQEALKWQKEAADLSAELRHLAVDAIPFVTAALRYLVAAFHEASAGVGEILIEVTKYGQDVEALVDPSLTWAQTLQRISDNAKIADLNIQQLNKDTAEAVRQALGMKAANADDPWGLDSLIHRIQAWQANKPSVGHAETAPKAPPAAVGVDLSAALAESNAELTEWTKLEELKTKATEQQGLLRLEDEKSQADAELHMHQLTADQYMSIERGIEDQRYEIKRKALDDLMVLEGQDPINAAKINAQLEALEIEHQNKMNEIDRKALEARQKAAEAEALEEQKIQNRMVTQFMHTMDQALFHAKSFGDALDKIWLDIERSFVNSLMRMLAQHAAHEIAKLAAERVGQAASVAAHATAATEKGGIDLLATLKAVTNAAIEAAAKTWAAVSSIPIIGPILAPAAAAAAFAGVEALGALASAEGGFDVPRETLTMLHPREMVLPAPLADTVRGMAAGGAAAGDTHIHVHQGSVSALDSAGVAEVLKRDQRNVGKLLERMARTGHFNPARTL